MNEKSPIERNSITPLMSEKAELDRLWTSINHDQERVGQLQDLATELRKKHQDDPVLSEALERRIMSEFDPEIKRLEERIDESHRLIEQITINGIAQFNATLGMSDKHDLN